MNKKILIIISCFIFIESVLAVEPTSTAIRETLPPRTVCDTDLSPNDVTSKFIETISCLNKKMTEMEKQIIDIKKSANDTESNATAAERAANRAAKSADMMNKKLDELLDKFMGNNSSN